MSEAETMVNGKGQTLVRVKPGASRLEKVFAFCKAYIEEHSTGPSLAVIAKGTDIQEGGVSGVISRLREAGRIECEPGNYASMRLPAEPKGKRRKKVVRARVVATVKATDGGERKAMLQAMRLEVQAQLDAIDALLATV